jgi:ribonuclease BN (tRNA processing enzyme)
MEPSFYNEAQVLIHETSFLYPEDADKQKGIHTDLKSLLPSVRDGGVRNLILFHSSRRYELDTLKTEIQKIIEDSSLNCPVILIRGAYNLLTD